MKPTLGRIVHYRTTDGQVKAACVTAVNPDGSVDLEVFGVLFDFPERFQRAVLEETATHKKNRWFWPPRIMA
jgi:hypothetical protein